MTSAKGVSDGQGRRPSDICERRWVMVKKPVYWDRKPAGGSEEVVRNKKAMLYGLWLRAEGSLVGERQTKKRNR